MTDLTVVVAVLMMGATEFRPPGSECRHGEAVLRSSRQVFTCRVNRDCPLNTTCTSSSVNKCCWSPPVATNSSQSYFKTGACPARSQRIRCGIDCDTDSDCPNEDKCCSHECGRSCLRPVSRPTDPCSTKYMNCTCIKNTARALNKNVP
ncbi:whey acidic protein-like [Gigantopelta aegis]|uniref:whey acidic protein-like n=1 Tax=Gigantopelta aegis TaxID=1735272 RepID=UPI001B88DFEB|nr:whey acidic protein-like [Gigantopelta aegis]